MKFFVDTADVAEIRELAATGLLDGVTTNPSLVAKAGRDFKEIIAEICEVVPGPVSAEVAALDTEGMLKEGRALAKIAKNVTVKVPLTWAGLKACKALTREGTMVNVTLCFSANQALLAAKAGATFISPFIGRLDDIGLDGMDLIREIRTIYDNYPDLQTRDPGRLHPQRRPRQAGRPDRRRRRHRAAGRAARHSSPTRSPTRASRCSSPTGRRPASASSEPIRRPGCLPGFPEANRGDRGLRIAGRVRVAAKGGPAGDRVGRQNSADVRGRQSAQDELAADREQTGLREIDLEREALAVAAKRHRAQLDFSVEVLSRRFAGRAKAAAQLGRAPVFRFDNSVRQAAPEGSRTR